MNDSSKTASRAKVIIERVYRARPDELWALWTTKDGFESWWGPEGFRAEVHTLEARVDGLLHYDMIADAPETVAAMTKMGQPLSHPVRARFSELRAPTRLAILNVIDFLPGVEAYEASIGVDLLPQGDSVRMVVTLDAMHDEAFSRMQEQGFTSQLTKLDRRFR